MAATDWIEHTRRVLAEAGHRASEPRSEVIGAIAELGCSVSAKQIAEHLDGAVGVASIYRALELLERLGLVKRIELGDAATRYEAAAPSGDHHHHIVCDSCGKVERFEDDALERAIHALADRSTFSVATHDVTLHGECQACS